MMNYNPDIHRRRSIRLKDYDYSGEGAYFVTICAKDRECLFGDIEGGEMRLNDAGVMIEKWWRKIPDKFSSIDIDMHAVMPNHFHGIIIIVGADPCVCPENNTDKNKGNHVGLPLQNNDMLIQGAHAGAPLQKIVQWFKTMTTNDYIKGIKKYNWPRFNGKLWQRNYYERVIRDGAELNELREYIINNPSNWERDENYITY